MKVILTLSVLIAACLADSGTVFKAAYYPSEPTVIDTTSRGLKIVNGHNASRNQFPYQVSIQRRVLGVYMHKCGGSILAPRWILTAAHCLVAESPSSLIVVAGILFLDEQDNEGRQAVNVSRLISHEKYPDADVVSPYDIALLQLQDSLDYGVSVQPIGVPQAGYIAHGSAVVSGWGLIDDETVGFPNRLHFVEVPVVEERECKADYDYLIDNPFSTEFNMCSGFKNGGEAICDGDSGGPLAQNNQVLGVVSWSAGPCGKFPSVYVKVSAYVDWIETHTGGEVKPCYQ